MNQSQGPAGVIRFGSFEADLRTGELRKGGAKVRIQELPFRVLVALLENQGNLVTRDELQKRLWSGDTFVDFDQGLGTAIRKLREALGDSAENPRFIETLPRRGFRFIAPACGDGGPSGQQDVSRSGETPIPQRESAALPVAQTRLLRAGFVVIVAVLVVVALAYAMRPSIPSPKIIKVTQLSHDGRTKLAPLVTDGYRVYFSELGVGPAAVSTDGGETVPISLPSLPGARVLDLSPDGQELLLAAPLADEPGSKGGTWPLYGLWAVPTVGGVPRRLGDIVAEEAVWSPDGKELVYIRRDDHRLYVASAAGTDSRTLVTVPGDPDYIRWSPDGKRLSLSVGDGKLNTLWEVSHDGTNLHPVFPSWDFKDDGTCSGAWTPDRRFLLFDSYEGGTDNVWAIREERNFLRKSSRQPTQLTSGPVGIGKPLPSKDGKRIFVISNEQGPQLRRYDAKSGEWRPFLGGISAEHVDISKDGQWATYISYPGENLFRSKSDGSDKLQLTSPPLEAAMPRFSPDGKTIAYMARSPGERWRIWLASSPQGAPRPLMSGGMQKETEPTWSPDGKKLAFYQSKPNDPAGVPSIYLFDLASKQLAPVPDSGDKYYPRWSPDGRYLAATADDFHQIMLFDFATQKWAFLAKSPLNGQLWEPAWSHDGKSVFFVAYRLGPTGYYYRVRVADGKVETAVNINVHQVNGPYGGWHGLTSDDSLLVLLAKGYSEIYALDWQAP